MIPSNGIKEKGWDNMKSKFIKFATSSFLGFLIDYALFCGLVFREKQTIRVRIFMRCGIVPDLIRKKTGRMENEFAMALQQCGIYTLTVGSIFRGILDIYGTTNHADVIYWWGGIGLFAVGILMECILHGKN